jgi:hypothetical protein
MADIYYAGITADMRTMADVVSGTSTTATLDLELRIGDGTNTPSRDAALMGLKVIERWIMQGGLNGAGTNLPTKAHSSG